MPLDVLVMISPKPGKEKRVSELLAWLTEQVEAGEPYALNYHAYRTEGEEENTVEYIVHGRFKDEEALIKRRELQHHHDIVRYIKDEDLLKRPLRYMKLEPQGGFDR